MRYIKELIICVMVLLWTQGVEAEVRMMMVENMSESSPSNELHRLTEQEKEGLVDVKYRYDYSFRSVITLVGDEYDLWNPIIYRDRYYSDGRIVTDTTMLYTECPSFFQPVEVFEPSHSFFQFLSSPLLQNSANHMTEDRVYTINNDSCKESETVVKVDGNYLFSLSHGARHGHVVKGLDHSYDFISGIRDWCIEKQLSGWCSVGSVHYKNIAGVYGLFEVELWSRNMSENAYKLPGWSPEEGPILDNLGQCKLLEADYSGVEVLPGTSEYLSVMRLSLSLVTDYCGKYKESLKDSYTIYITKPTHEVAIENAKEWLEYFNLTYEYW